MLRSDACGVHTQLIHTPARIAHSAHQQNAAPTDRPGPWEPRLDELFRRALHDPLATAT
jgi:hypothetical protein